MSPPLLSRPLRSLSTSTSLCATSTPSQSGLYILMAFPAGSGALSEGSGPRSVCVCVGVGPLDTCCTRRRSKLGFYEELKVSPW